MSGGTTLVDPAYLEQSRVFVRLRGVDGAEKDAARLAGELASQPLFGLPVQVVDETPDARAGLASLMIDVVLTGTGQGPAVGRAAVLTRAVDRNAWARLGVVGLPLGTSAARLDAEALATAIDGAIASNFVRTKVVRREPGLTTVAVENRLPMTISWLTLRATGAEITGSVDVDGLGLGPARSTVTTIPAPCATVERIAFNGL